MTIPIQNSNTLIFLDIKQWNSALININPSPSAVLLSSYEHRGDSFQDMRGLIDKLIKLDCKYFVCAGKNSEQLHDFIDDVIFDISLSSGHKNYTDIMTTWHNADTDEEVAFFFLHLTDISNGLLIVFLDESRSEDTSLKKAILNLTDASQT